MGTWEKIAVNGDYETIAAGQTAVVLGGAGSSQDYLDHLIVVPAAATGLGAISIIDNATSITVFAGGTIADVKPFAIDLRMRAMAGGPWKVTTGALASVIAVGRFAA